MTATASVFEELDRLLSYTHINHLVNIEGLRQVAGRDQLPLNVVEFAHRNSKFGVEGVGLYGPTRKTVLRTRTSSNWCLTCGMRRTCSAGRWGRVDQLGIDCFEAVDPGQRLEVDHSVSGLDALGPTT